jgi:hypothetical protein
VNDLLYRILSKCFLGALLALAMSTEARALSITPATYNIMEFDETSESKILAEINSDYPGVVLAYKQNVGGSEEGPFASSYSTTFANSSSQPEDATISYVSGAFISNAEKYLLVKDGNHDPTGYLFDLSALKWNGTETLSITGFWPGGGSISHVSILTRGSAQVPDGGATLMLLGIGLMSVLTIRRLGLPPTK